MLNIILVLLFSIPAVQHSAAKFALKKLKPILKTEMSIEKVRIKMFNTVELKGIYLEDQQRDTLLYAEKLSAKVHLPGLLKNRLDIHHISMDNFTGKVNKKKPEAPFNFQFIIDAFASDKPKKKKEKKPMHIGIDNIQLTSGTLRYDVDSEPDTPNEFNPNHLFLRDLTLIGGLQSLDMKRLKANILTLRFHEVHAGLTVDDFQGMIRSTDSRLWTKRLEITLNDSHLNVADASFDLETKQFSIKAKSQQIEAKDVAIFAKDLAHLNKTLTFDADLEGRLPQAKVHQLRASYGDQTRLSIEGFIADYNKVNNSDMNIEIKELKISPEDLEAFIQIGSKEYVSPEQLNALGNIDARLKATGKLKRFHYKGDVQTKQGALTLAGEGKVDQTGKGLGYTFAGPIKANNIRLASILGESIGLGDATLYADTKLEKVPGKEPMRIAVDGEIKSLVYKSELYKDLHFNGIYKGDSIVAQANLKNEDNDFSISSNFFLGDIKRLIVKGDIRKLNLKPFVEDKWENPFLSMRMDADMKGRNIDEMTGNILIDRTSLYDDNFIYNPGAIQLTASNDTEKGKKIEISSTILDGEIAGDYYLSTIADELIHALQPHLPSLIKRDEKRKEKPFKNNFNFNLHLKNTEDISYAFDLPFYNVEPGNISGTINMIDHQAIRLNAHLSRFMVGKNDIRETRLDVQTSALADIKLDLNSYLVQDNGHINAKLNTRAHADSLMNNLFFNVQNKVTKSNGELQIALGLDRDHRDSLLVNIEILPTSISFNKKNILCRHAKVHYTPESITIKNFGLQQEDMLLLGIEGVASKRQEDKVRVFFQNTDLKTILAAFDITNFEGLINGDIIVRQALDKPIIYTDGLRVNDIIANNDTVGDFTIDANWDSKNEGIMLDAYLTQNANTPFHVNGFVPKNEKTQKSMKVKLKMRELPLKLVQPFAETAFSELSGNINCEINVTGNISNPIAEGWLGVDKGIMKVAYTNVTYHISDTIRITKDNIGLHNLVIRDNNNHTALLNVKLSHSNFGKLAYEANIHMDDFLLLNNEMRTDLIAYGNLKLSGDIKVFGSSKGIFGNADLYNSSKSKVMIELPQTASANEYKGIIYINTPEPNDSLSFLIKDKDKKKRINTRNENAIPIQFRANVELNPMLEAGVLINPTTGDAIRLNGTAKLNVRFDSKSEPAARIYGDYIAQDGKFKYNIQGLKTIDFRIREGSTVTLIGNPLSTRFNITAYHPVNADLSTLSESFKTDIKNTRVTVNTILNVKGDLDEIKLDYGIELPDAPSDVQQKMSSLVSTQEAKIKQFAYLIMTSSFYSAEGANNAVFGNNFFTQRATGVLTKGLDALFAAALNDNWSISTNLQSEDGTLDNVRMGVDVSTRLLNDRLRIHTNFSYGDKNSLSSQQTFMGEFEAEYDINNWLMLRAFNRANQRFERRAPTTQGTGIVVTKEGKTFRELFRFRIKKKEEKRVDDR